MAKTILPNEVESDVKSFILGGVAEFTILQEPNVRFSYRVIKKKYESSWGVYTKSLRGVEEHQGDIVCTNSGIDFKSENEYVSCNPCAIQGLLRVLGYKNIPEAVHVLHNGCCSVCGKRLSGSDSISTGIGRSCRRKVAS